MRDGTVPKTLFKYLPYREDFFDELLLRITPPSEFNDPFDGLLSKDSYDHFLKNAPFKTEEERDKIAKRFDDNWEQEAQFIRVDDWGVICFTEKSDCLLMWAHYANDHKGIIIEFDTTCSGTKTHSFFEGVVDSSTPPKVLKAKVNSVNYPPSRERPSPKPSSFQQLLINNLYYGFSKSEEWAYEGEHRMSLNYNELSDVIQKDGMHFLKMPEEVISGIYIGCRADNAKEMKKKEIIDNFTEAKKRNSKIGHVKLFESVLDETNFKVNYKEICV
jgi:Protein of unknown function (DUF2971)